MFVPGILASPEEVVRDTVTWTSSNGHVKIRTKAGEQYRETKKASASKSPGLVQFRSEAVIIALWESQGSVERGSCQLSSRFVPRPPVTVRMPPQIE